MGTKIMSQSISSHLFLIYVCVYKEYGRNLLKILQKNVNVSVSGVENGREWESIIYNQIRTGSKGRCDKNLINPFPQAAAGKAKLVMSALRSLLPVSLCSPVWSSCWFVAHSLCQRTKELNSGADRAVACDILKMARQRKPAIAGNNYSCFNQWLPGVWID